MCVVIPGYRGCLTAAACVRRMLKAPLCAAEKLTEEEARAMLQDLQLAAPADEGPLVGLLSRWAARGRQESPEPQVRLNGLFFSLQIELNGTTSMLTVAL